MTSLSLQCSESQCKKLAGVCLTINKHSRMRTHTREHMMYMSVKPFHCIELISVFHDLAL